MIYYAFICPGALPSQFHDFYNLHAVKIQLLLTQCKINLVTYTLVSVFTQIHDAAKIILTAQLTFQYFERNSTFTLSTFVFVCSSYEIIGVDKVVMNKDIYLCVFQALTMSEDPLLVHRGEVKKKVSKRLGQKREKYLPESLPLLLPPCKICGKKASGIHYGVNTCEACKVMQCMIYTEFYLIEATHTEWTFGVSQ